MAKLVYITNGMASTLNSSLEFSRRLVAAGHEVVYMSHADLAAAVEGHGHRFIRLEAIRTIKREYAAALAGSYGAAPSLTRRLVLGRQFRRRSITSTEVEDQVTALQPDGLIIDIEMHYAVLATMRLQLPTVLPIVWFSIFRDPQLPPMHTTLLPPTTWVERARIRAAWWKMLADRMARGALGPLKPRNAKTRLLAPVEYDTFGRADLKAVARARGVDFGAVTDWTQWLRPHVYPRLLVLAFNAWEMEFPHTRPAGIEYVGPMALRDRAEVNVSSTERQDWDGFRARCAADGRPIVYCSLGTYLSANKAFLRTVVSVFQQRPEWALVLGLGKKLQRADLEPVPDNVLVMTYAPQLEILDSAAAAITHGGITSINECILCEVPMLVYSTRHGDQDGCAARVQYHGLGLIGDIAANDRRTVDAQLERLLGDASIREKVRTMKATFDQYQHNRTAENVIERLLAHAHHRTHD